MRRLPTWLVDWVADTAADAAIAADTCRSWLEAFEELNARTRAMQAEADRVHEACYAAPCACVIPRRSSVPNRCGACVGALSVERQRLAEPIGRATSARGGGHE